MSEVLEHHPELYADAPEHAKYSAELMTIAFARCPKIANNSLLKLHFSGEDGKIVSYLDFLQRQLEPYEIFQRWILGKMLSTQSIEDTGTLLILL